MTTDEEGKQQSCNLQQTWWVSSWSAANSFMVGKANFQYSAGPLLILICATAAYKKKGLAARVGPYLALHLIPANCYAACALLYGYFAHSSFHFAAMYLAWS